MTLFPQYTIRDRSSSSTPAFAIEWVSQGTPLKDSALGWSRVLVVRNHATKRQLLHRHNLDPYQVVARREIGQMRGGFDLSQTRFFIDDAEDLILDTFPHPMMWSRISVVSLNGGSDLGEVAALEWALEHTQEEIQKRVRTLNTRLHGLRPDPVMVDTEGDIPPVALASVSSITEPKKTTKKTTPKKRP